MSYSQRDRWPSPHHTNSRQRCRPGRREITSALEKLTPLVEAELRRLAHHYLAQERSGHTLQTTALINEAWLRLIDWKQVSWQNRAHFFGVSARLMRYILVGFRPGAKTAKTRRRGSARFARRSSSGFSRPQR